MIFLGELLNYRTPQGTNSPNGSNLLGNYLAPQTNTIWEHLKEHDRVF